jgi:hypothetical protein
MSVRSCISKAALTAALVIPGLVALPAPATASQAEATVATLPSPGKGCYWDWGVAGSRIPLYKNYGKRDKSGKPTAKPVATLPTGAKVKYEWCSGRGWVRVQYKGAIRWFYNTKTRYSVGDSAH